MSLVTRLRSWLPAVLVGGVTATGLAAVYAWRNPDLPAALAFGVMLALTWPILAAGAQILWFDRERTDADIERHAHDVERAWLQEAAATAFATLMGGLIALEYLGDALRLSWLSPIGLTHVLALGSGTFCASYAWLRLRNR